MINVGRYYPIFLNDLPSDISEHHLGRVFNVNGNHSMQTQKNNGAEVSYEKQAKSCTVLLAI